MSAQPPLQLFLSEARSAATNPLLATRRRSAVGSTPALVVGDYNIPVQVWFYRPDPDSSGLLSQAHTGDAVLLVGKRTRESAAATLFLCALTQEHTDERGDKYYSGTLALNGADATALQRDNLSVFVDVVVNGEATLQFQLTLLPQVYTGNEVAPTDPAVGLLQTLAQTATTAAAAAQTSATSANGSAVSASNSAASAATKATEAATSATSANGSAVSASNSAASAATSEASSATSSYMSDASAQNAATSEANAANSAASAATSAYQADTSLAQAESAAASANTAKTAAESARDAAVSTLAVSLRKDAQAITPAERAQVFRNLSLTPVRGGVALTGEPSAVSGHGQAVSIPVSGAFEIVFRVKSTASDKRRRALASLNTSAGEVALNFGNAYANTDITASFGDAFQAPVSADYLSKTCWVSFGYDGTDWFVTIDGVRTNGRGEVPLGATPVSIVRMLGGVLGGYGQLGGDVYAASVFNVALSSAERAAVMIGETPVGLVPVAATAASPFEAFNGEEILGATTSGYSSGNNYVRIPFNAAGSYLRLRFTCVAALRFNGPTGPSVAAGTHDVVVQVEPSGFIRLDHLGGNTVSNFTAQTTGIIADYRPEQVTSLGRWLDASGNGYDLLPGAGVTPLAPQPVQVRTATVAYDIGGSAPSVIDGAQAGVAGWKTAQGAFIVELPTYLSGARLSGVAGAFEVDPTYVQARAQVIHSSSTPRQWTVLTKGYNNDTLTDVSWRGRFDWRE